MENLDNLKERNAFADKMAKRFNTQQKDAESLKAKPIKMEKILDSGFELPGKLTMTSQPGFKSVKSAKQGEMPQHGEAKVMVKENSEMVD